jgi:hypothetical protein
MTYQYLKIVFSIFLLRIKKIEFMIDGKLNATLNREILPDNETGPAKWKTDGNPHSIYIRVRDKNGKLVLVGNPVYIEG